MKRPCQSSLDKVEDWIFDAHLPFEVDSRGATKIALVVRLLHRRVGLVAHHEGDGVN